MKRFNSAKWITENKHGKLSEMKYNNPFDQEEENPSSFDPKNPMSFKEQEKDPDAQAAPKAAPEGGGGTIAPKANLKTVSAETIVDGMLSGDENNKVMSMIKSAYSNALSPEKTKEWVENITREKLISRIEAVQGKIPEIAPSKAEMPALEPEDAEAVKDALDDKDGGQYAIDISEPFAPTIKKEIKPDFTDPKFPTDLNKSSGKDWLQRGKNDGETGDDKIEVKTGQSLTVGEMTPTQSNIEIAKSLFFATVVAPAGGIDKMDGFATDKTNGSAILDGHHRWSGQYIANGPGQSLTGIITVSTSAERAIPILRSIGNALGRTQKEGLGEQEKTLGDVEILMKNIDRINNQQELEQVIKKLMGHIASGNVSGGSLALANALGTGPASTIKKQFGIKESIDPRSSLYEQLENHISKNLNEYTVDYYVVYDKSTGKEASRYQKPPNPDGALRDAKQFIQRMDDWHEREEKERYERYALMFKDNPEDMDFRPNPKREYEIGSDTISRSMEE